MKTSLAFSALLLVSQAAHSAQTISVPSTTSDKVVHQNKLFTPDHLTGNLPLVLIAPEWWGVTDYPEMRAKRIADELGYAALVIDYFGNGKTVETPKDAGELAGAFYKNPKSSVEVAQSAVDAVSKLVAAKKADLNLNKVIGIGYCFGGTQMLNLARAGGITSPNQLIGVVSFHGGLAPSGITTEDTMKPKLLVLHGEADKMVSEKDVKAFKEEMKKARASLDFHAYAGAGHAFTNPAATGIGKKYGIPVAYNEKADLDSWERMKTFMKELFGR